MKTEAGQSTGKGSGGPEQRKVGCRHWFHLLNRGEQGQQGVSQLKFLINKFLGCYLGRERRGFQQGMDGHRENSGNKAMGKVMGSSGTCELNMHERKQLWVRSLFLGVTQERMGTHCGWEGHQSQDALSLLGLLVGWISSISSHTVRHTCGRGRWAV